jgi:acetyl esterase/lipase
LANDDLEFMPVGAAPRAVMGFFHGGSFVDGTLGRLAQAGMALARLGIGAISFKYRVQSFHGTMVRDAVIDAVEAAVRFRKNIHPCRCSLMVYPLADCWPFTRPCRSIQTG